jgi:hypothetical protein
MYICKLTPNQTHVIVSKEIVCKVLKPRSVSNFYRISKTFIKIRKDISEGILAFNTIDIHDIHDSLFRVPTEFRWLCQLAWGQLFALEPSKELKINPDSIRRDEFPYDKAREN